MSWFIFALTATLSWGFADIFYKKGSDENDVFSHLKTAVWVGFVMGAVSILVMIFSDEKMNASEFFRGALKYSPASFSYIASMVIGYAGMRYLEISIISPVQNASGALSAIVMIVWFTLSGRTKSILNEFSLLDIAGTIIIALGVIMLAITEKKLSDSENTVKEENIKYKKGALALIFPLLYCVFDTVGTAADGIILDGTSVLSEIQVLIIYGLTFFIFGACAWLYMLMRTKKAYNPFSSSERSKGIAAVFEEGGQVFYIYAMASKPVLAAPMIASYCIVSVILSRFILKERLNKAQYICVLTVITGIVMLGISEGLNS